MTNIQQLTLDLMLAHNIEYEEADRRARQYFDAVGGDRHDVLSSAEVFLPNGRTIRINNKHKGIHK